MEDVLFRNNFRFKKAYGQNFITDRNLLNAIVADAGVTEESTVLEIGTGAGALTKALAGRAKRVVSYEIDKSLQPVLAETLSGIWNVAVVFRDFAKEDLAALEKELGTYSVVANLPYYVTTPVILRFLEESEHCTGLTVMVQEEVAARLCAEAGTPEYGAITAALRLRGRAAITRKVPRTMFTPRPNVDSAVVRIDLTQGGFEVKSRKAYRETVRCAFLSRRKTFENNLISVFSLSRAGAKEVLGEAGIAAGVRGEALSPETLGKLSDVLFLRGLTG